MPHVHDARFRGVIHGIDTIIETGIRDTGIYRMYVTFAIDTGEPPAIVSARAGEGAESERVLALRGVVRENESLVLRIDPDGIEVGTYGKTPEELEAVIERVLSAWKESAPGVGPYR